MSTRAPSALETALGRVVAEQRAEWQKDRERLDAEARAQIAELRAQVAELTAQLKDTAAEQERRVGEALAGIRDGKDADPEAIAEMVATEMAKAVRALPPAKDGKDADIDEIREFVRAEVAALPPAEKGADGVGVEQIELVDGELVMTLTDGQTFNVGRVRGEDGRDGERGEAGPGIAAVSIQNGELIVHYTNGLGEMNVGPIVGKDGAPGRNGLDGKDGCDGIDGKDADPEEIERAIVERVEKAVAVIPLPKDGLDGKDGADIADLMIDRDDCLVATLTDGRMKNLGAVVGRNGLDGKDGDPGAPGRDGRDGLDGIGFDDLSAEYDGERTITLRAARGDNVREWAWTMPVVIDRGVYRDGTQYEKGDATTFGGSYWIATKETTGEKPGTGDGWRLAVKRGRDGKDAKAPPEGNAT